MFISLVIGVILLLIFTFLVTFQLGKSQRSSTNQQYDQSRLKTLTLLLFIYVVCVIAGVIYVFQFA